MADLVERGLRTLCFAKSRRAAELIHRFTADRLGDDSRALALPRRLHAAAAARDRAAAARGRAARRQRDERARARDRRRPARLRDLGRLPRHGRLAAAAVGPRRPPRARARGARRQRGRARPVLHARAASAARPARRGGDPRPREPARARRPRARGRLRGAAGRRRPRDARRRGARARGACCPSCSTTKAGYVWAGRDYPAARVSLRSTGPESFTIVDGASGTVLGIVEQERAFSTVHEGAIYLHLGESYRVRELDLETRTALVEPFSGDYYTQAKKETTTAIVEPRRSEPAARRRAHLRPRRRHRAGRRLPEASSIQTQESLELVPLELPQTEFETEAVWFLPEPWMLEGLERDAAAARLAACRRALADRAAAALGDVRPLGHRRPLDEPPLPDRPADDLRLRRPLRRRRDHRARLRGLRGLGRGHREAARAAARASAAARRASRARSAAT